MRTGHSCLVFVYILLIHEYTFFTLSGNLDPGSTHIISLSAHNKVGFSKSARLRVSLPTESRSSDAGESERNKGNIIPPLHHSRLGAELDPGVLLHLPAELHHGDAGAQSGPRHCGRHRLWTLQTQGPRYNAFINPHYWAYN